MPIVRSPCTLEWPRTGHTPAPGRPMLPRRRRKLTISRIIGTECLCWVSPIAQQTTIRSESSTIRRNRSTSSRARPVAASVESQSAVRAASSNSPKPWVCSRTKSSSTAPGVSRISLFRRRNRAWSPPMRIWRNRSVSAVPAVSPLGVCGFLKRSRPASGSGLTLTTRAPFCLAFSRADSMRGWLVPGFCPATTMRSARYRSSSSTLPLPTPIVSDRAEPDDSWHMLEQSGRLLVPSLRAKSW